MANETMTDKAQRLINDECVHELQHGIYAVQGDTKPHLVALLDRDNRGKATQHGVVPGACTCEARTTCSHLLAVDAMLVAKARTAA